MKKSFYLVFAAMLGISAASYAVHYEGRGNLLTSAETNIVHLGDRVDVENRTLTDGKETKEAKAQIFDPDGNAYGGHSFLCEKNGIYRVVYSAYFGTNEVSETISYNCQRRSQDLFTVNPYVTASSGEYRYNTKKTTVQGAIFDMRAGSEITFDTVFNPNEFTKNTPIIDFIIDPSEVGTADIGNLTVRITNVEDETDYVDVLFCDSGTLDTDGQGTYIRAGAADCKMAGYEAGIGWHYTSYGCTSWSSFRALPSGNATRSQALYFDYADRSLWISPSLFGSSTILINDLDGKEVYASDPWEGFKSDKVKISLIPSTFNSGSARVVVRSVFGIDLSPLEIEDTVAPTISLDYAGQVSYRLPKAKVGTPYRIFDATVSDNLDAGLKATASVTYYDSSLKKYFDVSVNNGYFTPTREGNYTISYNATDRSGNIAETKTAKVTAVSSLENLGLSLPVTSLATSAFQSVTIPGTDEVTLSGKNGNVEIVRTVYDPSGDILEVEGNTFTPQMVGKYRVVYEATDYIGSYAAGVVEVTSNPLSAPLFIGQCALPPVLVRGFTYMPADYPVVETVNGEVEVLEATVTADGADATSGFTAEGDEMVLAYTATGKTGTTVKTITVPVIDGDDTRDQAAYFYGDMTAVQNEDDITLSATKDSASTFANALNTNEMSLYFSPVEGKTACSSFDIVLTDAEDPDVSLTFRIRKAGEGYTVTVPGRSATDYVLRSGEFRLDYQNSTRTVYDVDGYSVGTVKTDDNGNAFEGFSSACYLGFRFSGVTAETAFRITKLDNQLFGLKGESYADHYESAAPIIVYDSALDAEQEKGDSFAYPTFRAYDVLSQIESASIRVANNGGSPLVNGDNECTDTFTITDFGRYTITYSASDTLNNSSRYSRTVYVYDDIAPELTVNDTVKATCKVGAKVAIPGYTASDDSGSVTVDVILILPDGEDRILTHDVNGEVTYYLQDELLYNKSFIADSTHFIAEQKGTYTLRFVAYDEEYNKTVITQSFEAK